MEKSVCVRALVQQYERQSPDEQVEVQSRRYVYDQSVTPVVRLSASWFNVFCVLSSSQSVVYPSGFTERITFASVPLISEPRGTITNRISLHPHHSRVFAIFLSSPLCFLLICVPEIFVRGCAW